jgi:uroporphyrinogen-III decarboxylase
MRCVRYRVQTPNGDLLATDGVKPGVVDTVWELEPLVKDVEDAEKLLSVPYRFDKPDLSPFFAARKRLGDRGVAAIFVTTPMVMVTRVTGLQKFMEWSLLERPLVDRLIETAWERVAERLQFVLEQGVGPLIRIGGCEQATPPLMSNRDFDEFIVKYEGRLWQMVRRAGPKTGHILWVHCHGKIATVLDRFIEGGVQLLEPAEPPPQGDIELAEAKRRAASGPMTLMGNIEVSDLEKCSADEIEAQVRRAICEGGRQRFILGASAQAVSAIDNHLRANMVRFIEAGVKYGTF